MHAQVSYHIGGRYGCYGSDERQVSACEEVVLRRYCYAVREVSEVANPKHFQQS